MQTRRLGGTELNLTSVGLGTWAIGGGDWAPHRIVPDAARSLAAGKPILLRHPRAVRPWQHVLDPLEGYLRLAIGLEEGRGELCRAFNFGPDPTCSLSVHALA